MTISKTDILTDVRERLNRGSTLVDINDELETILREVSHLIPKAVQTTTALTATSGVATLPSDFITLFRLYGASGQTIYPVQASQYDDLKNYYTTTVATSAYYLIRDDKLYLVPAIASESVNLVYAAEQSNVDSITLDDCFYECLAEGVCYLVELGKGVLGAVPAEAATHKGFYDQQIAKLAERYKER